MGALRWWVVTATLATVQHVVHAQARNYNVLFGTGHWLNFYNEVATVIPCSWPISKRSASISEPDGALSVVVDETGIHNANFDLVQGGGAQDLGWPTELASLLILPKPDAPQHYVVFLNTTEATKQAGYVEVDMSANGGSGAVVGSGTTWYLTDCTAKLAATLHANGTDYWLLQHTDGTDTFHAYLFTASGLAQSPVISNVGPMLGPTGSNAPYSSDHQSSMKFSVSGEQLLMGYDLAPDTMAAALFWFSTANGGVTLRTDALRDRNRYVDPFTGDTLIVYGVSAGVAGLDFLNTDDFAYVVYVDTSSVGGSGDTHIVQYDLGLEESTLPDHPYAFNGHNLGGNPWGADTLGESLLLAADGELYLRTPHLNTGYLRQLNDLPGLLGGPDPSWTSILFPGDPPTWGLPLFCKRYHDSDPAWLGQREEDGREPAFRAVPNPIAERGALVWGNSPPPDHLIWRDAMGRLVRSEPALNNGPTTVLARKELPAGLYVLEVFRKGKPLGSTRVMIE
ncbi:MAG: hypothetical protein IPM49_06195 [Flavobacteriales bacterium]|nr:hypothetical protein [Flavobacteriales bacterium]